ncbi:hypothetical protein [Prochlorococcus sp. MIT 1223]|uniref:hypothetical protein n=1 Tax=Prochlorococcus sp. MIT 1223 TaxID=3096217 RepID=UPI002A75C046|nr:hypothetical protein [Prochlorococcus sp. MIT 1223]
MNQIQQKISFKFIPSFLFSLAFLLSTAQIANAQYRLVIGSYRQGPGSKPHVSGITSPSLFAIPTETLKQCQDAGEKISKEIYKPVWQFDNMWTCIYTGK